MTKDLAVTRRTVSHGPANDDKPAAGLELRYRKCRPSGKNYMREGLSRAKRWSDGSVEKYSN